MLAQAHIGARQPVGRAGEGRPPSPKRNSRCWVKSGVRPGNEGQQHGLFRRFVDRGPRGRQGRVGCCRARTETPSKTPPTCSVALLVVFWVMRHCTGEHFALAQQGDVSRKAAHVHGGLKKLFCKGTQGQSLPHTSRMACTPAATAGRRRWCGLAASPPGPESCTRCLLGGAAPASQARASMRAVSRAESLMKTFQMKGKLIIERSCYFCLDPVRCRSRMDGARFRPLGPAAEHESDGPERAWLM